jgi:hypothetical protein
MGPPLEHRVRASRRARTLLHHIEEASFACGMGGHFVGEDRRNEDGRALVRATVGAPWFGPEPSPVAVSSRQH